MDKSKTVPKAKNGNELKRGLRVDIYQDPITELRLEGPARLMSFVCENPASNTENWMVQFDGEIELFQRKIKIHNADK